jgi:membrane-associated phospholipid phosphatase
MNEFLRAQLPMVQALQHAAPWTAFWKTITLLGNEEFFLLLIPLVYWCINRSVGLRLGVLILAGDALNVLLKMACALPRPNWFTTSLLSDSVPGIIRSYARDASYGLPSSHAQNAFAVWFFLADRARNRLRKIWPMLAALLLILLISLSRVALGVHFPGDIVAGWAIGAAWLWGFMRFSPALITWFRRQNLAAQISWSLVVSLGVVVLGLALRDMPARGVGSSVNVPVDAEITSVKAVFARAGALFGLGVGVALMWRMPRVDAGGAITVRVSRFIIGFIGILVIWRGLDTVFPKEPYMTAMSYRFVRYALLAWWISHGASILFLKTGLSKESSPNPSKTIVLEAA